MSESVSTSIPTEYGGVVFRSRLEARYAAAFDCYGLKWKYEPQLFDLEGSSYIPDFYFKEIRTFFEVKGPSVPGEWKAWDLQRHFEKMHELSLPPSPYTEDDEQWSPLEDPREIAWSNPDRMVILGRASGSIHIASYSWEIASLVKCLECSQPFFVSNVRSWACRACGAYRGDQLALWLTRLDLPKVL